MSLIVNLNKPSGITSQEAIVKVRDTLGAKKAGHSGTLDPMASGVLIVLLDKATRLSEIFLNFDKEYLATMKLGEATDTQDVEGKIISKVESFEINRGDIEAVLKSFVGSISQIPPMYSAIKHEGMPLYKLARKGIEIHRSPREVFIHELAVEGLNMPLVTFRVRCSKGTYIRTLCNDIGIALGVGAHLFSLIRTKVGPFTIKDAVGLDELLNRDRGIYSIDDALSWMKEIMIRDEAIVKVKNGAPLKAADVEYFSDGIKIGDRVRIKAGDNTLLAIGIIQEDMQYPIRTDKVIMDYEKDCLRI